jgi:epoxyqueuosine reductase
MKEKLSRAIKDICEREGFFKSGFSKFEKLSTEIGHLKTWVNEGRNADMEWISRHTDKREDVSLILNGIKSIISLAYIYDTPFDNKDSFPKISRYAWGKKDYHKVLKKKLKNICKEIESLSEDVLTKFYVDDGPVLEKVWAVKSGIGWMGKHSNIITADAGSFFFLSEILINKELEYDNPVDDLCETCMVCVDACPTGAIYEEYKVDAKLCISYQTIENKNDIPSYLDLSGWIFGCDVCQDVCPYNKKKFFTEDESFYPMNGIFGKSANELSGMSEEEFNKVFADSPVKRTKYAGWKRNLKRVLIR